LGEVEADDALHLWERRGEETQCSATPVSAAT